MPTVYVSQLPSRRDPQTGTYVPAYNIGPASEHGELRILAPSQAPFMEATQIVPQMRAKLAQYDYAQGDCLLLLGNTVVISAVVALVAAMGDFRVLLWDKNIGRYLPVIISTA